MSRRAKNRAGNGSKARRLALDDLFAKAAADFEARMAGEEPSPEPQHKPHKQPKVKRLPRAKKALPPIQDLTPCIEVTSHAVERFLERACGLTPEDMRHLAGLGGPQRRELWEAIKPLVLPPEIIQGVLQVSLPEERCIVIPGSHVAILRWRSVTTVLPWPGVILQVPSCLWPYLEKTQANEAQQLKPAYRVHSPLGLHRSVKVSAAHRFGSASVSGIACRMVADEVKAEMREGLSERKAIEALAEFYSIPARWVRDSLDYQELPPYIRGCWTMIGNWETAQYWAAINARKETE